VESKIGNRPEENDQCQEEQQQGITTPLLRVVDETAVLGKMSSRPFTNNRGGRDILPMGLIVMDLKRGNNHGL